MGGPTLMNSFDGVVPKHTLDYVHSELAVSSRTVHDDEGSDGIVGIPPVVLELFKW